MFCCISSIWIICSSPCGTCKWRRLDCHEPDLEEERATWRPTVCCREAAHARWSLAPTREGMLLWAVASPSSSPALGLRPEGSGGWFKALGNGASSETATSFISLLSSSHPPRTDTLFSLHICKVNETIRKHVTTALSCIYVFLKMRNWNCNSSPLNCRKM